jgi:hypothetical protein
MKTYVGLQELSQDERDLLRGFFAHRHRAKSDYTTQHAWVGEKIWKPVDVATWAGKLIKEPWNDLLFQHSIHHPLHPHARVFRARRRPDGNWNAMDADSRGDMVCLCFESIPTNWTYFQIVKVHYLGTGLVVKPVVGTLDELLKQY